MHLECSLSDLVDYGQLTRRGGKRREEPKHKRVGITKLQ
jgi:hypothetical protein